MKDNITMPTTPADAPFTLPSLNAEAAERLMTEEALRRSSGSIIGAAALMGLTRHALKRRIDKHGIPWTRAPRAALPESTDAS